MERGLARLIERGRLTTAVGRATECLLLDAVTIPAHSVSPAFDERLSFALGLPAYIYIYMFAIVPRPVTTPIPSPASRAETRRIISGQCTV